MASHLTNAKMHLKKAASKNRKTKDQVNDLRKAVERIVKHLKRFDEAM